ncbi:MAG: hypothetical protein J0L83_14700 [Chitinophagales bacterium]|nr:hypothetical protein [Chitinophagales bacterium]
MSKLQLIYKGEAVDLVPGATTEIERNSPFFMLDAILAEYSMPVGIADSERNARLFPEVFNATIKSKTKYAVSVLDDDTLMYQAILVFDKSITNYDRFGEGAYSAFLKFNISNFFDAVKDKNLSQLNLGGTRSFNFTTWDKNDASGGFWQHVHDTWNGNHDYIFAPFRNETWVDWEPPLFSGWLNELDPVTGTSIRPGAYIVPLPKLGYIIRCIVEEHGWKLDASAVAETIMNNRYLLATKANDFLIGTSIGGFVPPEPVVKLNQVVDAKVNCKDLFIWFCKRYGIAPDANADTRIVKLMPLNSVANFAHEDITEFASRLPEQTFDAAVRAVSFKQSFTGNDEAISEPAFENLKKENPVASFAALPAPSANYDNSYIFAFRENAFYKIGVNETTNQREWQLLGYNIFNVEVQNETEAYESSIAPVPSIRSKYRTQGGQDYFGFFPYVKQPRNASLGIRVMAYHGLQMETNSAGAAGSVQYPYMNICPIDNLGNSLPDIAEVFEYNFDNLKLGIIQNLFAAWMEKYKLSNIITIRLFLPLHKLLNLQWNKVYNIRNQPFLLKSFIQPLPYKGMIQAKLHPIVLQQSDLPIESGGSGGGDPVTIYVRLAWEEMESAADYEVPFFGVTWYYKNVQIGHIYAYCYSDPNGVNLYTPTNLRINVQQTILENGVPTSMPAHQITMNSSKQMAGVVNSAGGIKESRFYTRYTSLDPTEIPFEVRYQLLPGTGYVVIE